MQQIKTQYLSKYGPLDDGDGPDAAAAAAGNNKGKANNNMSKT